MKTISQVSDQYDVSLRTLRFYEEKGLLHPARAATSRFYDEKEELRLRLILTAKRLGFSLKEIAAIVESRAAENAAAGDRVEVASLLTLPVIAEQIERLEKRRAEVSQAIVELQSNLRRRQPSSDHRL